MYVLAGLGYLLKYEGKEAETIIKNMDKIYAFSEQLLENSTKVSIYITQNVEYTERFIKMMTAPKES